MHCKISKITPKKINKPCRWECMSWPPSIRRIWKVWRTITRRKSRVWRNRLQCFSDIRKKWIFSKLLRGSSWTIRRNSGNRPIICFRLWSIGLRKGSSHLREIMRIFIKRRSLSTRLEWSSLSRKLRRLKKKPHKRLPIIARKARRLLQFWSNTQRWRNSSGRKDWLMIAKKAKESWAFREMITKKSCRSNAITLSSRYQSFRIALPTWTESTMKNSKTCNTITR